MTSWRPACPEIEAPKPRENSSVQSSLTARDQAAGCLGAAILGGAVVGAAVANSAPYGGYYADGYRRCRWERQYDAYGFYVGTAKVCRYY